MADKKETKEKDELQPGEVEHEVTGTPRIISDGGSAGRMIFDLGEGRTATLALSIEQPPPKEDEKEANEKPTGHDPTRAGALPEGVPTGSASLTPAGSLGPIPKTTAKDEAESITATELAQAGAPPPGTEANVLGADEEGNRTDMGEHADQATGFKGKIADGFPNKAALEGAGITTHAQLRKAMAKGTDDSAWYTDVTGVGPSGDENIRKALKAGPPKDE